MAHDKAKALERDGRRGTDDAVTTVLFTAHNRKDMVLQAIELALAQTVPVDIVVADDASNDGTREAVLAAFPDVMYLRSEQSRGPCYQRNRGLEAAKTDIVFPLDDDSMLVSERTLEQALAAFADPRVGIVAMPFKNSLQDDILRQGPDWMKAGPFFDFIACAHGLRKDAVLSVGGYFEPLFYMGEETDLAIRLFDRGFKTVICSSDPIHHLQPPARRSFAPDFYGRRNDALFVYLRAPGATMPLKLATIVAKGMWYALRTARIRPTLKGFAAAFGKILGGEIQRAPVSAATYSTMTKSRNARRHIV